MARTRAFVRLQRHRKAWFILEAPFERKDAAKPQLLQAAPLRPIARPARRFFADPRGANHDAVWRLLIRVPHARGWAADIRNRQSRG